MTAMAKILMVALLSVGFGVIMLLIFQGAGLFGFGPAMTTEEKALSVGLLVVIFAALLIVLIHKIGIC